MAYLYKIPYELISRDYHYSDSFLPVKVKKKPYLRAGMEIAIYRDNGSTAGIIAMAYVASDVLVKPSELTKDERQKLYNTSLFQIRINMKQYGVNPFIYKRQLFHFPSLNDKEIIRPWNEEVLYWGGLLCNEIDFLYHRFPESPMQFLFEPDDHYWKLKIHILRESALHTRFYRMTAAKASKCSLCSFPSPNLGNYFELHETVMIDFDKPFEKIDPKNFIVVCPNCHKIEHQKIRYGEP